MADARLGISVTTDAKQASATFKELAADIKKVGTESVGVTEGVARVDAAMAKLAKAPDTPKALAAAVAKAKVEIDELRAALDKTPASAEKLKSINAALAQAESAMQRTIVRAGKLKESQEEVAQKMGITAKGAEAMAGKLGSAQGVMGMLADSSSGAAQGVAKLGFAAFAVSEAWKLAKSVGEGLAKAIDEWSARQDVAAKKTEDAAVAHLKFENAMRLARQGLIDIGGSQDEFMRRYDEFVAKKGPAGKAIEEETRRIEAQKKALDELGSTLDGIAKREGFSLKSPDDAFMPLAEAEKYAQALNDILSKAFADGGEQARDEWAKANEETLNRVEASFKRFGAALPPVVQAAYDAMKAGAKQTAADILADVERAVENAVRMRQAAEAQGAAARAQTTATEGAERAQRALNEATHDGITEMNGWVGVQGNAQRVYLTINEASKERIELLKEEIRQTKALREEQLASLDATKGWMDYVVGLQDAYASGAMSLYNLVTELGRFRDQLQQIFGGVTGKAKEELQAMLDLITELVSTAGAGGPVPSAGGYAATFERDANRRK